MGLPHEPRTTSDFNSSPAEGQNKIRVVDISKSLCKIQEYMVGVNLDWGLHITLCFDFGMGNTLTSLLLMALGNFELWFYKSVVNFLI